MRVGCDKVNVCLYSEGGREWYKAFHSPHQLHLPNLHGYLNLNSFLGINGLCSSISVQCKFFLLQKIRLVNLQHQNRATDCGLFAF